MSFPLKWTSGGQVLAWVDHFKRLNDSSRLRLKVAVF